MSEPVYVNEIFFPDQELKFSGFENITFVVKSSNGSFVNLKAIKNTEVKKDAKQELQHATHRKPRSTQEPKPKEDGRKTRWSKIREASKRSN